MTYRIDIQGSRAEIFDLYGRVVYTTIMEPGEAYAEWLKRTQFIRNELQAYKVQGGAKVPKEVAERIAAKYAPEPKKPGGRFAFKSKKANKPSAWEDKGGGTFLFRGVSMQ